MNCKANGSPFYSINAKDDKMFLYDDVVDIYNKEKNSNWYFKTIDKGGHGFIYHSEDGVSVFKNFIRKLLDSE